MCVCVCYDTCVLCVRTCSHVCVCMHMCERDEDRKIKGESLREGERGRAPNLAPMCVCVCTSGLGGGVIMSATSGAVVAAFRRAPTLSNASGGLCIVSSELPA